jgi:hypothetical protein
VATRAHDDKSGAAIACELGDPPSWGTLENLTLGLDSGASGCPKRAV